MKSELKKLFTLLLAVMLVTGCGCSNKKTTEKEPENNNVIENKNEEVIKDQEIENGIKFEQTSLTYKDGVSNLMTTVTNNKDTDYTISSFNITVKDSEGNVMTILSGYVGDTLAPGESRIISSSDNMDLSTAASIEYTVSE